MVFAPHYILAPRIMDGDGRGKVALMREHEEKAHLGDFDVDGMTLNGF